MLNFHDLHLYTKTWLLSEMVVHSDSKCEEYIKKYIPGVVDIKIVDTPIDRLVMVKCNNVGFYSFSGTKNGLAWVNNLKGIEKDGFHLGIITEAKKITEKYIIPFFEKDMTIVGTGQSRGAALSLLSNYLLRTHGYKDVESVGFSGPYVATKKLGIRLLKKMGVRHTNILSDSTKEFWSDPVDDVGVIRGKHYGYTVNLAGSAWIFDHSYVNITNNLGRWMSKKKFTYDAEVIATIAAELAKK